MLGFITSLFFYGEELLAPCPTPKLEGHPCRLCATAYSIYSQLPGGCLLHPQPKRDEVTGGWRKLHNEELHNFYSSPSIIRMIKSRRMRWTENVARMGENSNAYRIIVGNPEGKRPLGRPRRR
jgi:hypothetical protein